MRVYLDSCVFQNLKEDESLYNLILSSRNEYIYCYSEAHLSDLSRDKSDEKYNDMLFMEQIVENNCFYYYNNKVLFEKYTPSEYYISQEWSDTPTDDLLNSPLFQKINPDYFSLKEDIKDSSIPDSIKNVWGSNNLPNFGKEVLKSIEELCDSQKYKKTLQYFHNIPPIILKKARIKGFNGNKVTCKSEFFKSYRAWCIQLGINGQYNLFISMYNGLEYFGIVKGKPKKQKMMNQINDSQHSFFGGYCDIVVSKDKDFIQKTKFMYEMCDFKVKVLNIHEFSEFLSNNIYCIDNDFKNG